MRCFIGVDIPAPQKLALDSWRQKALPEILYREDESKSRGKRVDQRALPYAIPPANFHMTLAFLGHIDDRQHETLIEKLSDLRYQPFSFTLDVTGIWNGPKILFAAPSSPPEELMALAKGVRKAAHQSGIGIEGKGFEPHVTLIRKATVATPLPLFPPGIECQIDNFHLFESVSGPRGVSYPIRHSWSLHEVLSVREQLRRGITQQQ